MRPAALRSVRPWRTRINRANSPSLLRGPARNQRLGAGDLIGSAELLADRLDDRLLRGVGNGDGPPEVEHGLPAHPGGEAPLAERDGGLALAPGEADLGVQVERVLEIALRFGRRPARH